MPDHRVVRSTADLTPDGILGYAKGIAAFLIPILLVVVEYLPEDDVAGTPDWKRYTQLAIAILGAIAVIGVSNKVKPTPVTTGPDPIVGVVPPPVVEDGP